MVNFGTGYGTPVGATNFGQRAFSYTPPTGFKALNTANLTAPTIKKPSLYMDATLRTGTGATANVSSLGFQPDLVWIKSRSAATNHNMFDSGRKIDITLLVNELKSSGDFELVGGAAYLAQLANSVPNAAHAIYYGEIVRSKATLRRLIDASSSIL